MVSNRMFILFLYSLIRLMFLNFFSEILDSSSVFLPPKVGTMRERKRKEGMGRGQDYLFFLRRESGEKREWGLKLNKK